MWALFQQYLALLIQMKLLSSFHKIYFQIDSKIIYYLEIILGKGIIGPRGKIKENFGILFNCLLEIKKPLKNRFNSQNKNSVRANAPSEKIDKGLGLYMQIELFLFLFL
ncbi:hypothetical protein BpHYR1_048095 [Brachionus plicatilis]|uniref:Uncharacterized protein n=1 Tax=Brachionus plicatilis TaxID=10195 RepID=A0A3M7S970_BRAPC|nr:hypothetical protein BpHYR1_048095 [Brachionus plicatilis]